MFEKTFETLKLHCGTLNYRANLTYLCKTAFILGISFFLIFRKK